MMSPGFAHTFINEGISIREADGVDRILVGVKTERDPSLEVRTAPTPPPQLYHPSSVAEELYHSLAHVPVFEFVGGALSGLPRIEACVSSQNWPLSPFCERLGYFSHCRNGNRWGVDYEYMFSLCC